MVVGRSDMQAYSRGGLVFAVVEGGSSWAHNVRGARLARVVGRSPRLGPDCSLGLVNQHAVIASASADSACGARMAHGGWPQRRRGVSAQRPRVRAAYHRLRLFGCVQRCPAG